MTQLNRSAATTNFLLGVWIVGCATCIVSGWILSLFNALNVFGYTAVLLISVAALVIACRRCEGPDVGHYLSKRFRACLKRPLPALYLIAVILSLCGGIAHAPNNYDALTYRFPRILHWWSTGSWHWIVTNNQRMNYSAQGFEWLTMPLFIFTKTHRLFFLLNWFAYLLMPVLIFSVFRQLGISRRVAWFWMWLLPLSYCYVLQAGSICNDAITVTFVLGAIHFTLQARRSRQIEHVWLALLAAGLCSGIKPVNLPLYLPIAIVVLPVLLLLRARPFASIAVFAVTLAVSYVPTALLNIHYTGGWSGDPLNKEQFKVKTPRLALVGNTIQLADENLAPPVLPFARKLETKIWQHFPEKLRNDLTKGYPRFLFHLGELPQEESSGLGLGTMIVLLATLGAALFNKTPGASRLAMIVGGASWLALFAFMLKAGMGFTMGRLTCAYYPLLVIPILAMGGAARVVRSKLWQLFATICAAFAILPLLLTPSRPILPMPAILNHLAVRHPHNAQLARASEVFNIYASRHDALAPIRRLLPSNVTKVGFISDIDDTELSLWFPIGSRTVQHITNVNSIATSDLQWIVAKRSVVETNAAMTFENWAKSNRLETVGCVPITEKFGVGAEDWCLVHKLQTP